jgi:hypothetical protein
MPYGQAVNMPQLQFGVLQEYDLDTTYFGNLSQRVYRVARQSTDGRVLMAMVIRPEYSANEQILNEDRELIGRILESATFY